MKKCTLTALWVMMLTALAAVTAYADLIPMPGPVTPDPAPEPDQPDTALITVLIVAVAVIAAAVAGWIIFRHRRAR